MLVRHRQVKRLADAVLNYRFVLSMLAFHVPGCELLPGLLPEEELSEAAASHERTLTLTSYLELPGVLLVWRAATCDPTPTPSGGYSYSYGGSSDGDLSDGGASPRSACEAQCTAQDTCAGYSVDNSSGVPVGTLIGASALRAYDMRRYDGGRGAAYVSYVKRAVEGEAGVACLQAAPTQLIVDLSYYLPRGDSNDEDSWGPVVDGVDLEGSIVELIARGASAPVNVLLGANLDEGSTFMGLVPPVACDATPADFLEWCANLFGPGFAPTLAAAYATLEQPLPVCGGNQTKWNANAAAMRAIGDEAIVCRVREAARQMRRQADVDIYTYLFRHTPLTSVNWDDADLPAYGAFHGAEVPFAFGDAFELGSPQELTLAATMGCYWRNFIHAGDPNAATDGLCSDLPPWPRFEAGGATSAEQTMLLETADSGGVRPRTDTRKTQCDAWLKRG